MSEPLPFKWKKNDQLVVRYLNRVELQRMKEQQKSDEYNFEFHDGHDNGYPIYIRPTVKDAPKWKSNIPKLTVKNNSAQKYPDIKSLVNGPRLGCTKNKTQNEILNIIRKDWVLLATMAERFWTKVDAPIVLDSYKCTKCNKEYDSQNVGPQHHQWLKWLCKGCKKYTVKKQ